MVISHMFMIISHVYICYIISIWRTSVHGLLAVFSKKLIYSFFILF